VPGKRGLSPPSSPEPPPSRTSRPKPEDWESLGLDGFRAFVPPPASGASGLLEKLQSGAVSEGGAEGATPGAEVDRDQARSPGPGRARTPLKKRRPFSAPGGTKLPLAKRPPSPNGKTVSLPASTMICGMSWDRFHGSAAEADAPAVSSTAPADTATLLHTPKPMASVPEAAAVHSPSRHGPSDSAAARSRSGRCSSAGSRRKPRGYPIALVPPSSKPGHYSRTGPARPQPPRSALPRASSTGALRRSRPSSSKAGEHESSVPHGTHIQGTTHPAAPGREGHTTCSWLTSEPSSMEPSKMQSEMVSIDVPTEHSLRSGLDYSELMAGIEICGQRIGSSPLGGIRTLVACSPTGADGTSAVFNGPPESFVLGVPLGLEASAAGSRGQESVKQPREVSAVLPRVAPLDFSGSA
jgi:hypothetical protein